MRRQLRPVNPLHRRAVQRLRFPGKQLADKEFQMNGFFGIGVGDFFKQSANGNLHTELLADFADEALLIGFMRLALAAGKFPQTAEVRMGVAPGNEKFTAAKDERGADFNAVFSFKC